MRTNPDEMTLATLLARISEMEQEMAALRAAHEAKRSQEGSQPRLGDAEDAGDPPEASPRSRKRRSRRGLLRAALVAATSVVGASALLTRSTEVAHADGNETPTTFTSTTIDIPAVTAEGFNGAAGVSGISGGRFGIGVEGVSVSSVSGFGTGTGVLGVSGSGIGVFAQSTSGPALVANGHVQVQGDAVGTATLLAGNTSVTVTTSATTSPVTFCSPRWPIPRPTCG